MGQSKRRTVKGVISVIPRDAHPGRLPAPLGTDCSLDFHSCHPHRSVAQSCPTLCDPIDCSTPGFPVLHHPSWNLLKLMSIELVMSSKHLLLCCSLLLLLSIFPIIRALSSESSHQVAKVLELQLQHQSFQWIFRVDFLQDWLVWSPFCPRDSQESPKTS